MDNYTIIGDGLSGTVYYPALPCKDGEFDSTGYVSKLTTRKNAEYELEIAKDIKRAIPEHAIYAEYVCDSTHIIQTKGQNRTALVFSKYGGVELTVIYNELEQFVYSNNVTDEDKRTLQERSPLYHRILIALRELQSHVITMNERSLFHNDISADNIVYSDENQRAYLIDFERSGPTHKEAPMSKHMPRMRTDSEIIASMVEEFSEWVTQVDTLVKSLHGGRTQRRRKSRTYRSRINSKKKTKKYKRKGKKRKEKNTKKGKMRTQTRRR